MPLLHQHTHSNNHRDTTQRRHPTIQLRTQTCQNTHINTSEKKECTVASPQGGTGSTLWATAQAKTSENIIASPHNTHTTTKQEQDQHQTTPHHNSHTTTPQPNASCFHLLIILDH